MRKVKKNALMLTAALSLVILSIPVISSAAEKPIATNEDQQKRIEEARKKADKHTITPGEYSQGDPVNIYKTDSNGGDVSTLDFDLLAIADTTLSYQDLSRNMGSEGWTKSVDGLTVVTAQTTLWNRDKIIDEGEQDVDFGLGQVAESFAVAYAPVGSGNWDAITYHTADDGFGGGSVTTMERKYAY